jgi:hypothetical protein
LIAACAAMILVNSCTALFTCCDSYSALGPSAYLDEEIGTRKWLDEKMDNNELLYCTRFGCSDPHMSSYFESLEVKRRRCRDPSKRKKKIEVTRQAGSFAEEMIPIVCLAHGTARTMGCKERTVVVRLGKPFAGRKCTT